MIKVFNPFNDFEIIADTCGTARQKTLTFCCGIEVTEAESKEIMATIGEALGWLKMQ